MENPRSSEPFGIAREQIARAGVIAGGDFSKVRDSPEMRPLAD